MSTTKKTNVVPIIMMFLLFAMIAFVTNLCNPMGVIVKNQFSLSNFQCQLGNLANFIAYLVMGIPSGLLLKKIGYKKTALLAIAIGFVGVFLEYVSGWTGVQSFWVYLVGAFIAGFCMCMLNAVVNPMLNTIGGGGNHGNQLVQFGGVCNSLAATAVTIFGGALIGEVTKNTSIKDITPALFIALGVFAVVFVVLSIVNIPEPETNVSKESATTGVFKYRHFDLGILAIFLYIGVEVGLPTYVLQYLSTPTDAAVPGLGINAAIAATIAGVYWLLMLCGRLVGGIIGANVSSRKQVSVLAVILIVFVLIGMFGPKNLTISIMGAPIPVVTLLFVLGGLCTSIMWGGIFNMAVEGLGKYTEFASGMFMTMVFGGAILIPLQGWVADFTGSFLASYIVVLICTAYILFYALVGSRVSKNKIAE
jgi:FHS family L-fucose permease-like MFS transporter